MPTSQNFRIRIVAGASFAFAEGMMFNIHDTTNGLLCVYDYRGISWSLGTPGSASLRGPWNEFSTRIPMEVGSFGGIAGYGGGGGANVGVTVFTLNPLTGPRIDFNQFQTGFTAGATLIGAGTGAFMRMFPPIAASSAPFPHNV